MRLVTNRLRALQRGALALTVLAAGCNRGAGDEADLIVVGAAITTQDDGRPAAEACAVRDGVFVAVGTDAEALRLRGAGTRVIDAGGRRLIPGLVDSHLHAVRGGRFYNLELRWDGVASLAAALQSVREQAARTPSG
jgi:predicted amidohydrolase YtcJ